MQPLDPERLAYLMEAASVTQEAIDGFKAVSNVLIAAGRYERLNEAGMLQAVDRLGYEISKSAFETQIAFPNLSNEEVQEIPAVKTATDQMQRIMETIAFGSGMHIAIISGLVGERSEFHTQAIIEKLPLFRK